MTKEEALAKINEVYREYQGDPEADLLTEDMKLMDDVGLDSLEIVELSIYLEEDLDIKIPDSVIDSAKTVGDLAKVLTKSV